MKNNLQKLIWLLIFLANLGIILFIWWRQSGDLLFMSRAGIFIAFGRLTGLLAVYLVLWQLLLIGRIRPLEQILGLDRLSITHHFNGLLAWVFIFLHPLFLILGYGQVNDYNFWQQTYNFLFFGENLVPAFFALLIFLVIIILSSEAIKKHLKYEVWYYIHLLTYLAIILSFSHQLELGGDLQTILANFYWSLIYTLVVTALIFYRFLKPIYFFYRHRFIVDQIIFESDQVISVYLRGRELDKFVFHAGQFAICRFLRGCLAFEAHPFSFSSAPNNTRLRLTIKNLGDFTGSLKNNLSIGTPVILDGPHGIFTVKRTQNQKLALIAGGIGITPIRSIIEKEIDRDLVLIYSAPSRVDLVFFEEISGLQRTNFHFVPVVSSEESWPEEKGRLDEEKIKRLVPDYLARDFFLCGPPLMIKSVRQILQKIGVKKNKIYFEKFSFN